MKDFKELLLEIDENKNKVIENDKIEVVGLSIATCLKKAASHWNTDLISLDYEILEEGKSTLFKTIPFRLKVKLLPDDDRYKELTDFSLKLGLGTKLIDKDINNYVTIKNKDGRAIVRNYRQGVFLTVFPPLGNGKFVSLDEVKKLIRQAGTEEYDLNLVQRAVKFAEGKQIKLAELIHRPENDISYKLDVSNDKMKAHLYLSTPRRGGLHLQVNDVASILKSYKIVRGFKEKEVEVALNIDDYNKPILVAEGQAPKHGNDAKIDYKVKVKREFVTLNEDANGRVDFKNLNSVENVVIGQLLAQKIPAGAGVKGYNLYNEIVQTRDGKDTQLKAGKGTLLSSDGMRLTAQTNGQASLVRGLINVEPIYRVMGDVGPKTGNISFIGSVYVHGSVLSGFEVKASSNIEVHGSVTKAHIEAEGNIILPSGVTSSKIDSTMGNVYAKYIQDSKVYAAENVLVAEGILRSYVDAGISIICTGRRAQVVGGRLRALKEIRARLIGSIAFTATEITAGTDPMVLAKLDSAHKFIKESEPKLEQISNTINLLLNRKKSEVKNYTEDQELTLKQNKEMQFEIEKKCADAKKIISQIKEQIENAHPDGKIHVEKNIYPGVTINILNAKQSIGDTFGPLTLTYENGYIKMNKLEKDQMIL